MITKVIKATLTRTNQCPQSLIALEADHQLRGHQLQDHLPPPQNINHPSSSNTTSTPVEAGDPHLIGLICRLLHSQKSRQVKSHGRILRSDTTLLSLQVPFLILWSLHRLLRTIRYHRPLTLILLLHRSILALILHYLRTRRKESSFSTPSLMPKGPDLAGPWVPLHPVLCFRSNRRIILHPGPSEGPCHHCAPGQNHNQEQKTMKRIFSSTSTAASARNKREQKRQKNTKGEPLRPLRAPSPLPHHPPLRPQRHSLNLTPQDLFSCAPRSSVTAEAGYQLGRLVERARKRDVPAQGLGEAQLRVSF